MTYDPLQQNSLKGKLIQNAKEPKKSIKREKFSKEIASQRAWCSKLQSTLKIKIVLIPVDQIM